MSKVKAVPRYLYEYLSGCVEAIFFDSSLTSLCIGGILLGFATGSIFAGAATFFLGHVTIRLTNAFTSAIVAHGKMIAYEVHQNTVTKVGGPEA